MNLIKLPNGLYAADFEHFRIEGPLQVVMHDLQDYGFQKEELDQALIHLKAHNHSRANFGIAKTFIITKQ